MNSHTYQALTRITRLVLRSAVIIVVLLSLLAVQTVSPRSAARAEERESAPSGLTVDFSTMALSFVPNMGQLDPQFRYHVRGMGSDLLFAPDEIQLIVPVSADDRATQTVHLSFVGADQNPSISPAGLLMGTVNYLYGNDPDQWLTNISTYSGLMYEQLYPGISLHYDGTQGMLKGTYLILPGADPDVIRWQYSGITRMQLDPATQDLQLYLTDAAESVFLTELAPLAWQEIGSEQVPVEAHYTVYEDQTIGFTLGSYDPAQALYVDPSIQFSTYLGGASDDEGFGITVDDAANAYITGRTHSDNLPTEDALYETLSGEYDAYVTKISMSTNQLVFSTYLGSPGTDIGTDIAVDGSGNIYVTGETRSPLFPISSAGVFQPAYAGNGDGFVVKLNASGSSLLYSSFLGGSLSDRANGIAVDNNGNAYVIGETSSTNFPSLNALSGLGSYQGDTDAFVTKINTDGTSVLFSTFLGGLGVDRGYGIAVDSNYVYVTGRTASSTGFSGTYWGAGDVFVAKFTSGTPNLVYANYLGGTGLDEGNAIAIDGSGKAYVTGVTDSSDFPPLGALSADQGGTHKGGTDAFVTVYNGNGTRIFSTYLSGSLDDNGSGIGVDNDGDIYVVGQTQSSDFPYVAGFQDDGLKGLSDAFITKIVAITATLEYSSFIGGGGSDLAYDLAVAGGGSAYITGATASDDTSLDPFPTTPNTFERGGAYDAFVTRIGSTEADVAVNKVDDIEFVAIGQNLPYTITVRNLGPDASTVTMTDTLSENVTFVSSTPDKVGTTCSHNASTRTVTCALGEMLAGEVVTIALVVNVTTRPKSGTIYNQARVTGTEYDPHTELNNFDGEYTVIYAQADLEVTKQADSYRVRQNEEVTFSILIHNLGPGSASGVKLTDVLPPEVTYVSHVAPAGTTFEPTTGLWTVGPIAANATTTLQITALVGDLPIGTIISNTANNLLSVETDPDAENNSSTIQLRVVTDYPEPGCHPSPTNPDEVICLTH